MAKIKTPPSMYGFINKIDFKELKSQKAILIKLQEKKGTTAKENSTIEGILNLIDHIQDIAVDSYGYNEKAVFKLSRK